MTRHPLQQMVRWLSGLGGRPRPGTDGELLRAYATNRDESAWRFWTLDWGTPTPGEHAIRSRAYDQHGNLQPTPQDPHLTSRRTFWESNGQITRRVLIP